MYIYIYIYYGYIRGTLGVYYSILKYIIVHIYIYIYIFLNLLWVQIDLYLDHVCSGLCRQNIKVDKAKGSCTGATCHPKT